MSVDLSIDPRLPFGEINVVILTDVHSWVAGHGRQQPELDADYGAVLSFYKRLKDYCNEKGLTLFFVSNGDWAHGTGLAAPGDPSNFLPILEKMPWDAVNCGNHELYEDAKVATMIKPGGFVDWFGDRYLTANIELTEDGELIGNRFKVLEGLNNTRVLTFGFLYDMTGACDSIKVIAVKEVVQSQWFLDALHNEVYSAILVLAHMDKDDPLVTVILNAIRNVLGPSFPVQFVTGHTHYRGETQLDEFSRSFEAGRYLDTIGFVSFPTHPGIRGQAQQGIPAMNFSSVFIDASVDALADQLGIAADELWTEEGAELSHFIGKTREKMGLTEEIGCAPHDFVRTVPVDDPSSIFGLYRDEVVPKMFFEPGEKSVMYIPTESFRYDLFSRSRLIVDDVWAVCPFNDTIVSLGTFTGDDIITLNKTLQTVTMVEGHKVPQYLLIGDIDDPSAEYKFYTEGFGDENIIAALSKIDPAASIQPVLTASTSTELLMSFVKQEWPCNGDVPGLSHRAPGRLFGRQGGPMKSRFSDGTYLTIILIIIALICVGIYAMFVRTRRRVGGVSGVHRTILSKEDPTYHDTDGPKALGSDEDDELFFRDEPIESSQDPNDIADDQL